MTIKLDISTIALQWFIVTLCLLLSVSSETAMAAEEPVYIYGVEGDTVAPVDNGNDNPDRKLRILYHRTFSNALGISETEQRLVEGYASEAGLTPVWVEVKEPWQLLNQLLEGHGDIIVSRDQGVTGGIDGQVRLLEPWSTSVQQVVARQDSARIEKIEDLAYRQVALKRSSPVWNRVSALMDSHSGMDIITIPESMTEEDILEHVKTGKFDLTIMDSLYLRTYLPEHAELAAIYDATEEKPMAWAIRSDAEALHQSLNTYLKKYLLAMNLDDVARDDLPVMQEKKSIRLITYQSPANLYYNNGQILGFEYKLLELFAKRNKMRVDLVLAGSNEEMKALLLEGKGDVIAASLPRRSLKTEGLAYTRPYLYTAPVVVGRESDERIVDIQDLEGRRIHLPAESPYRDRLDQLRQWYGVDFQVIDAHDGMNTETTLFMVSQGMYDLTVVPQHQLRAELKRQIGLRAEFPLGEPESNVWVVRAGDTRLLANLNKFINREYKKSCYNSLYARFIKSPRPRNGDSRLLARVDQLSPYDTEIREVAEKFDFDWRLIAAQMYQESQFNPKAVSPVGARGLMQIMPATAKELGVKRPEDPRQSINGGVAYLGKLRDSFEADLMLEDRIWFSLAAYNAGLARIEKIRKYTAQIGLDPNRWFDNVEQAMLALAQPAKRDGKTLIRCRCGETVVYVREIKTLYQNYINLTEATQTAGISSGPHFRPDI